MIKAHKSKLLFLILCGFTLVSRGQSFVSTSDNLLPLYSGKIEWADLDNDNDLDIIYSGFVSGANQYFTKAYENVNGSFVSKDTELPNIRNGAFASGDYDNDGDQDILISGLSNTGNISALYENSGSFNFTLKYSFPGLINATASWFDIDNDEDLDFLLAGVDDNSGGPDPFVKKMLVYKNSAGSFSLIETNLPPCTQCSMDWADSNGDGKIDLIITGFIEQDQGQTRLYLNNGDYTYRKDEDSIFKNLYNGDVKWGDFDRDGDIDVLLSGIVEDGNIVTLIYENTSGKFHVREDIQLVSVGENWFGGTKWVDYNNDGLLDILVSGRGGSVLVLDYVFKLYMNNGNGTFGEVLEPNFEGIGDSSVDFGDFDNDGDVDFCFIGTNANGAVTGVYENKILDGITVSNNKPTPPPISSIPEGFFRKQVTLQWSNGADAQTPSGGLAYNFYLRHGTSKITSPAVNFSTGHLLTDNPPNGQGKQAIVNNIPEGDYFWAVQSVDGSKAGSLFSAEKNFYQINGPEIASSEIVDGEHVKLSWLDNSIIETSYHVARSLDPLTNFSVLATLAQNASSFIDNFTFLTDTYYYYRVHASNTTKASAYDYISVLIPTAPTNLSAQSINASKIDLFWEDQSGYETGFAVERKLATGTTFETIATVDANIESYTSVGLENGTRYDYRVRAINKHGSSAFSNISSAETNFRPMGTNFGKEALEEEAISFAMKDFTDQFSDPNAGDALVEIMIATLPQKGTLMLSSTPAVLGQKIPLAQLGNVSYVPFTNTNGTTSFDCYNNDGKDNSAASYTVTLTIIPVNDFPSFTLPLTEVKEDFTGPVTIKPMPTTIPEDEQTQVVTYSIQPTTSDKVTFNFNSNTGEILFSSILNKFGAEEFTITANDGQSENNTFTGKAKLNIQPVNDPPLLSIISDLVVESLAKVAPIAFTVDDVDDPIASVLATAISDNETIIKNDKITIQGATQERTIQLMPEPLSGVAMITLSATDGKATAKSIFKFTVTPITGISEVLNQQIKIFPNPFTSVVHLKLEEPFAKAQLVVLHDPLGHQISSQLITSRESVINLVEHSNGIYILSIVGAKGEILYRNKIIKR
jgi:uncharacterized protein YuzB (UPF0349 family)